MIESNVILKILKKNITYNYNYLINKKYKVIVKICMDKILVFKKKKSIYFVNVKNFNNHLTNNFNIIKEERLTSLANKVERKFV